MFNKARSQFEAWAATDFSNVQAEPHIHSSNYLANRQSEKAVENPQQIYSRDFVSETAEQLKKGIPLHRTFTSVLGRIELTGKGEEQLGAIMLEFNQAPDALLLQNMGAKTLRFISCVGRIVLRNLFVRSLMLAQCVDVQLDNCWIEQLDILNGGIGSLQVSGGGIYRIFCRAPGTNPFGGSVHFDRSVYFPRSIEGAPERVQAYRNMRAHMLELENTLMVNRFHTLEQATERRLDRRYTFQRFVSWLYEMLSDYGASALRPLLWFLALLCLTTAILYLSDGVETVSADEFRGWQTALIGHSRSAAIHRAVALTMQSTLNPFGIFGPKGLVVARCSALEPWLLFHGLATTVLAALFILAIRRRFKMQ